MTAKQIKGGQQRTQTEEKRDGWANVFSGVGTGKDPRASTRFRAGYDLNLETLESLYRFSGLGRKIVNTVPDLVTKDPWTLEGDTENATWDYLERFGFNAALRRAAKWARLHGGGIVMLGILDGGKLDEPVNPETIRSIEFCRVYDRWSISETPGDWNTDPNSARFGKRDFYTVFPRAAATATSQFRVHWSRVIEMQGAECTEVQRVRNWGWGDSILQVVYEDIKRFVSGADDAAVTLRDFVQGVLQVKNLTNLMATPEGEKIVVKRLNVLDMSRHILNTLLVDEGETYSKQVSSIAGVPELLDRLMGLVSMTCEIPQTILFGRSPAGMNATGEADFRSFYDSCGSRWREDYQPAIKRMCELAHKAKDFPGKPTKVVKVCMPNLWKQTAKEIADERKTTAETDKLYIDSGVLDPQEVAMSRFGGQSYSPETRLLDERKPGAPEDPGEGEEGAAGSSGAAA